MINIVCNIDKNYTKYCTVMLLSLLENNKSNRMTIYIIASDLTDIDKKIIRESISKYDCIICFYDIDDSILNNCPIREGSYITVTTYFRIFLSSILPENIEKVLYLDCDLIVRKDLKDFWDTDIEEYAIACVEDTCSNVGGEYNPYSRLGYDRKYSYFNAGVILFNLKYCREHNIEEKCINYIKENISHDNKLIYYDQDVLNAVLHDKKKFVSFTWNTQEGFYRRKRQIRTDVWTDIDKCLKDPAIIHYLGKRKPWDPNARYPLRNEWFKYLDMSRWKGERPPHYHWNNFLSALNKLGILLRIDKPRYISIK